MLQASCSAGYRPSDRCGGRSPARLRELDSEAAEGLAIELAGLEPQGLARLAAGMIVLTVRTAIQEAIRVFEHGGSSKKANAALFILIDRGFAAVDGLSK